MAEYNGHPSWAAWNVSLWINNDEGLYRLALDCIRRSRDRERAAKLMVQTLRAMGKPKTPDGAIYSWSHVQRAMRGMK